jgi:hypothetical protein
MAACSASWFETRKDALLTMRVNITVPPPDSLSTPPLAATPGLGAFAHQALRQIQFSNSRRLLTRLRDLAAALRASFT